MHDDDLRAAGPPPLSSERHAALRAALIDEIVGSPEPSGSHVAATHNDRSSRRRRLATAGLAVALVGATATAAAAVTTWLRPDPVETHIVIDRSAEDIEAHNPGWRPELMAEIVDCASVADQPPAFNAFASDFPLGNAITAIDYVRACTSSADALGTVPPSPNAALCAREGPEIPALVIVMDGRCGSGDLEAVTDEDLAVLNGARRMEVSLLAFPETCPTPGQASEWVQSRIDAENMPLTLAGPSTSPTTTTTTTTVEASDSASNRACFRGWVSWPTATVTIDAYRLPN